VLDFVLHICRTNFLNLHAPHKMLNGPALGCFVSNLADVRQERQLHIKGHLETPLWTDPISWLCKELNRPGPWYQIDTDSYKESKFKTKRSSLLISGLMVTSFAKLTSRPQQNNKDMHDHRFAKLHPIKHSAETWVILIRGSVPLMFQNKHD
jgi:hypothetical protein